MTDEPNEGDKPAETKSAETPQVPAPTSAPPSPNAVPPLPVGLPPGFPSGFPGTAGRGGGTGGQPPPPPPPPPKVDPLTEAFYKLRCPACQAYLGNHAAGQLHRCIALLYAASILKEHACPTCGKFGVNQHSTPESYACMDSYFVRKALDRTFLDLLDLLWKK